MRPATQREKLILWIGAAILLVVGFWYGVYTPKSGEIGRLSQQVQARTRERDELRAAADRREALAQQVADLKRQIQELEAKLPPTREIPSLLVQLERLGADVGADVTLIKPGPTMQAGGAAVPQTAQPTRPGQPAQPAAASPLYQQFALEISAEGTFEKLEKFVQGIETFPRFIAMSDLRFTPLAVKPGENPITPKLSLGLTGTTYVVPESGVGQ